MGFDIGHEVFRMKADGDCLDLRRADRLTCQRTFIQRQLEPALPLHAVTDAKRHLLRFWMTAGQVSDDTDAAAGIWRHGHHRPICPD
ncbi:hypothetical protein [Paracoccus contaminans]|uniref:Uncharacterized protein n=1 Tax=Paracoccus contaminans TaxID=1945662 RepID=A0A1W6CY10_9RHOB|nr:hypothetical protein B0A89_08995 [Paracoccus contaminans]